MSIRTFLPLLALSPLVLTQNAMAQDDEALPPLDLTMRIMTDPNAELPEVITQTIELPAPASDQGVESSADGRARTGNDLESREEALERAADARERGQDFGQDMAESAREARENQGRSNPPERPEPPNPPERPGGPPGGG